MRSVSSSRAPTGKAGFTAEEIVGWNFPDNNASLFASQFEERHIKPLQSFGEDADPLVSCLSSRPVRLAFDAYERWDSASIKSQAFFKRRALLVPAPTVLALLIALLLFMIPPAEVASALVAMADRIGVIGKPDDVTLGVEERLRDYAPWIIYLLLILTPLLSWVLAPDARCRAWKEERALAEAMRREIFARVMRHVPPGMNGADAWLLQLKLEYFRRWQVEVQNAFFQKRPKQLRAHVRNAFWAKAAYLLALLGLATILIACSVAAGDEQGVGLLSNRLSWLTSSLAKLEIDQADYWSLLSLVLALLLFGFFGYRAKLGNPIRDAARYETMRSNFETLLGQRLADARKAASAGDEEGVWGYVDSVHSIMSLELNDWVRLDKLDIGMAEADRHLSGQSGGVTMPGAAT